MRSSTEQLGYRDCPAQDLSTEDRKCAAELATSLFTTPDFATLYGAASRVVVSRGGSGSLQASFYSVDRYLGAFRRVRFAGPMRPSDQVTLDLMAKHKAQFASVPLLYPQNLKGVDGEFLPSRTVRHAEDFIINLPSKMQDYLSRLGRTTRKHLPYYLRRLEREYGSRLRYIILADEQIPVEHFERLMSLNRARMRHKGSQSGWNKEISPGRWTLAQKCGLFTGICLDGAVVAGTLCYLFRRDAYLVLIAHAPEYDMLNLGNISLYKTIEQLIESHYSCIHLLWGQSFYKRQFGGTDVPLYETTVFGGPSYLALWQGLQSFRNVSHGAKPYLRPIIRSLRRHLSISGSSRGHVSDH